MNKKYQVFVSSTYEDLKDERLSVINTILEMDCIPAGMEAFCAEDEEQFEVIKKVIDLCDYYILIIGKRYGSINESKGISYTEMEYDYALEKGIPVLVFIANDSVNLPTDENQEKLKLFKEKAYGKRMGAIWKNADDLSKHVATSLSKAFNNTKRPGWTRDNVYDQSEILSQLNVLRNVNEKLEKDNSKLTKNLEKLRQQNQNLIEQLNVEQNLPDDIIPLEKLTINFRYLYDDFTYKDASIKAEDIFKYVSIKMLGLSFSFDYLKEKICEAIGLKEYALEDKTLLEKICNYFLTLKLMSYSWNEKNRKIYYSLTQKGVILRNKLNGFYTN